MSARYEDVVSAADAAGADVHTQWTCVDINWSEVRAELDRHWTGEEPANLSDDWTGSDENQYRNLVARALERLHAAEVQS